MTTDEYQQAWQTQASQSRITVDADVFLREVQRNQREFRTVIFGRDLREVGIALVLLPLWFYLGRLISTPWTWYLSVPTLIWTAGFMLVYRMRHQQAPSQPDEPLLQCVQHSLAEVEAQIWLLRNVHWWYLLPPGVALVVFFVHVSWLKSTTGWEALIDGGGPSALCTALYYWLYRLNQSAVRLQLEPRRQELLSLLSGLCDDGNDAPAPNAETISRPSLLRQLMFIAGLSLVTTVLCFLAHHYAEPRPGASVEYPWKSPFSAIRWQQSQPEVKVGDEWFALMSLDDHPVSEIIAFGQKTYGDQCRKRFAEDLVELLTRMGHPPGDTVTLGVQLLNSPETKILKDVPMTAANRQAIRRAAGSH